MGDRGTVVGVICWTLEMLMETEHPQQAYELWKAL